MSKNKIFVKTAKGERGDASLTTDLKRMLSYMDGKSSSSDLAKRAPPSLRKKWDELLGELIEGGFISDNLEAHIVRKLAQHESRPMEIPVSKPGATSPAINSGYDSASPAALVAAERAKQAEQEAVHARAELEAAAAAVKVTSDAEAKAEADAKQKDEKAARAAELKAYFAAAKEKAKAEAKQARQEAERARTELDAAAVAAKARANAEAAAAAEAKHAKQEAERARAELEATANAAKARANAEAESEAKAKAEAKKREHEAARARIELEAAVAASKVRSEALAKAKEEANMREQEAARARTELEEAILAAKLKSMQENNAEMPIVAPDSKPVPANSRSYKWRAKFGVKQADQSRRLHELEAENVMLKELLQEAYVEVEVLKKSVGTKP
jgi:hypothetical protein